MAQGGRSPAISGTTTVANGGAIHLSAPRKKSAWIRWHVSNKYAPRRTTPLNIVLLVLARRPLAYHCLDQGVGERRIVEAADGEIVFNGPRNTQRKSLGNARVNSLLAHVKNNAMLT